MDDNDDFSDKPQRRGLQKGGLLFVNSAGGVNNQDPTLPQVDKVDDGAVWWFGKRIYLGRDTQVRRLFDLLTERIGSSQPIAKCQRAVDTFETSRGLGQSADDIAKADQRLRKALSRIKRQLAEHGVDDHVAIIRDRQSPKLRPGSVPGIAMVFRHGQPNAGLRRSTSTDD